MTCQPTASHTEYDFVVEVAKRHRNSTTCCGPMIRQGFSAAKVFEMVDSFLSPSAQELLWENFDPATGTDDDAIYFVLCALHWMELACLISLRGHMFDNRQWRIDGANLLAGICQTQGWDPKEIANAFTWQRVQLE